MKQLNKKTYLILGGLMFLALPLFISQFTPERPLPRKLEAKPKPLTPLPVNPFLEELIAEFEESVSNLLGDSKTPGAAIAIVKDSSIVYMRGFGLKATGTNDSVDIHTVFRLASVSKCFAAVLTGILVKDSLLRWNDHVVNYIPAFALKSPEQTAMLNLRHILSHSTGLPYHTYTNLVEEGLPLDSLLTYLKDVNMVANVGELYSYQNVAYSLIGKVIEAATLRTYEDQMQERIFGPLNMHDASLSYKAIMQNNNVAKPHGYRYSKRVPIKINDTYYNVAPAGGINASISDMANMIKALLGNRKDILPDSTLDTIFSPVVKAPSKNRNYGRWHRLSNSYYALGWRVLHYPDDTLVYHGGYVNGYRSEIALNRKDKIGICILTNSTGDLADSGIPTFFNLFLQKRDSIRMWDRKLNTPVALQPL